MPEFQGASGGVGGYNAFYVDIGDSTFQIDGEYRTSILVDPPNGRFPPLSEQGKERMKERAKFMRKNTGTAWWIDMETGPYDDMELRPHAERCLLGFGSTAGPPALPVMYNNLKRIVQTEDHVMILNEMNHDARVIRIDQNHDETGVPSWLGDSIARWEGDELVITTRGFRDELSFTQGTKDMVVEERFSRMDADNLLYKFTVDRPQLHRVVHGRVSVAGERRQGVRVCMSRRQLLLRRHHARSPRAGEGRHGGGVRLRLHGPGRQIVHVSRPFRG